MYDHMPAMKPAHSYDGKLKTLYLLIHRHPSIHNEIVTVDAALTRPTTGRHMMGDSALGDTENHIII